MEKSFWNNRYGEKEFIYGEEPNEFLVKQLAKLRSGNALFVAEGEGRNAVYAATKGWQVEAFDYSVEGQKKAIQLAKRHGVTIDYLIAAYENYQAKNAPFDLIVLIYNHTDSKTRKAFNKKLFDYLKPRGSIIMEQFSTKQLGRGSGGPKNIDMLLDIETAKSEFKQFNIDVLEEKEIRLKEGKYHEGEASVIRMIANKR
jgi:2-polyprenyl-3-methyl-5-hydroxy-6-metoxy-1,4-benzoquinol methylase